MAGPKNFYNAVDCRKLGITGSNGKGGSAAHLVRARIQANDSITCDLLKIEHFAETVQEPETPITTKEIHEWISNDEEVLIELEWSKNYTKSKYKIICRLMQDNRQKVLYNDHLYRYEFVGFDYGLDTNSPYIIDPKRMGRVLIQYHEESETDDTTGIFSVIELVDKNDLNSAVSTIDSGMGALESEIDIMQKTIDKLTRPEATLKHRWVLTNQTGSEIDTIDGSSTFVADVTKNSDNWEINVGHHFMCCADVAAVVPGNEIDIFFDVCEIGFNVSDPQIRGLVGFWQGYITSDSFSYYSCLCWDPENQCYSSYFRGTREDILSAMTPANCFTSGKISLIVNSTSDVDIYVNDQYVGNFDPNGYLYLCIGIPEDVPVYNMKVKQVDIRGI